MNNSKTKKMVLAALFIALEVVFTRMLSINTPFLRIGFSFLPVAMCSILLGPVAGGVAAAIGDIIGATLFPTGPFFPGFTLNAFLSGALYGMFTYRKAPSFMRSLIPVIINNVFVHIILGTFWLTIILNKGYIALLPGRITKNLLLIPIESAMIFFFWKYVIKPNEARMSNG